AVDGPSKRAVRICAGEIFVIEGIGGNATVTEIPLPKPRETLGFPTVVFPREGNIILDWRSSHAPELPIHEVDTARRKLRSVDNPPLVRGTNRVLRNSIERAPSPDGTLLVGLTNDVAMFVTERDGRERIRWGRPNPTMAHSHLAMFLHGSGLEIVGEP